MSDDVIDGEVVEETVERHMPAVQQQSERAVMVRDEMTVDDLIEQREKIQQAVARAMTEDEHYGVIPGAGKRKVLLKPGAEMLNVLFRLAPSYVHETSWDGPHMTVVANCILTHAPTGMVIATGSGMCTTKEAKYAYRQGQRLCPECGKATVRKGKARGDRAGNWYCWDKPGVSDGCGATWELDGDQGRAFDEMDTGRVDNPDLPDTYNTVLKMADKRALVAAVLNGTAASDFFTQDMEEALDTNGNANVEILDPATKLLPTAIKGGDGVPARIFDALKAIDPLIDWPATINAAIEGCFGVTDRASIPAERGREFWIRLANATARAGETQKGGDFPPVDTAVVEAAFEWAFGLESFGLIVASEVTERQAELDADAAAAFAADADHAAAVDRDVEAIGFGDDVAVLDTAEPTETGDKGGT